MKEMDQIFENIAIRAWSTHFRRAPKQVNALQEMDAELIEIQGLSSHYLAVTIDTVAEEITTGLYQDPYTMGWVTVMASMSDLAAVGAEPTGLVISVSCEPKRDDAFIQKVAEGMEDACRKLDTHILGGDTNVTESISLTACCFGLVKKDKVISRMGCKAGDTLFITGAAGSGNALGLARLTGLPENWYPEQNYRPLVNIKAGQLVAKYASCCMDTSDGVLTTIDQLMRLNNVGFYLDCNWKTILDQQTLELCKKTETPPWMMLAGLHGEFLLLCTIPAEKVEQFESHPAFEQIGFKRLGKVTESPAITLNLPSEKTVTIDMAPVRNLLQTINGDLDKYVQAMWELGEQWGLNTPVIKQG